MRLAQGILTLLLLLCLAGAALASRDATLRYGGGGQGMVVFDSRLHSGKGYVCDNCHLELFPAQQKALISIRDHFKNTQCFSCHDNTTASRDCASCHRSLPMDPADFEEQVGSLPVMAQMQIRPLAPAVDAKPLLEGRMGRTEQTRACLSCHVTGNLKPVSDRGKVLGINLDVETLAAGPHGSLACVTCHAGSEDKDSFTQVPHKIDNAASPACLSCHKESMAPRIESFRQSIHYERMQEKVSCGHCHDAHSIQRKNAAKAPYLLATSRINADCLACHADSARLKELSGRDMRQAEAVHAFLSRWDSHIQMVMCVECHSAPDRGHDGTGKEHAILKKEEALRDCAACHTASNSLILTRAAAYAEGPSAFGKGYMPGMSRSDGLDRFGKYALILLVLLIAAHAARRCMSPRIQQTEGAEERVFVYPGFVRISHWLNAIFFITLLYTGLSIRFAGASSWVIGLETALGVHTVAGMLLALNFAALLIAFIVTGEIRQYLPRSEGLAERLGTQARYYFGGIFKGETPPFAATRENRFNPLQQVTYLVLFIIGVPLLILSGLALFLADGDRACLAWIHYGLAMLYGFFLMGHMYLATTGKKPGSLIKGMVDGYIEK